MSDQQQKIIWVLGSRHTLADKSILWSEPFPNFSECDILVVNTCTFPYHFKIENMLTAKQHIFELLNTGGEILVISRLNTKQNYSWCPVNPETLQTTPGERVVYPHESKYAPYLKQVKRWTFYFGDIDTSYVNSKLIGQSQFAKTLSTKNSETVFNKANQVIGLRFNFEVLYTLLVEFPVATTGSIYFLPQPTEVTPELGIDILLGILAGGKAEPPPHWEETIDLPTLHSVDQKITDKMKLLGNMNNELRSLQEERSKLTRLRQLLWTNGITLEEIVKDAFLQLGFLEIRRGRARDLEDWVIDVSTNSEYQHCVFEAKGSLKRTSLANLTQCNKWVDDYVLEKKKVKGIFVPNQHRLEDPSDPSKVHFEPNELHYAETRDICILTSKEIFGAVSEKLKGNPSVTREFVEKKMLAAKGLCRLT